MIKSKYILSIFIVLALVFIGWLIKEIGKDKQPAVKFTNRFTTIDHQFELIDASGKTVTEKDFAGKLNVVYFGFTYCPDICPMNLGKIATLLEDLGPENKEKIVGLFITIDPERDTPSKLKNYLSGFSDNIVGLSGNQEQINKVADHYKVYHQKVEKDGIILFDHSSFVYLFDQDGNLAKIWHMDEDVNHWIEEAKQLLN